MLKHCPITGVNIIRFLLSVIAGFIFIFIFDFILHANLLAGIYAETAHLWRSPEEMQTYFPFMVGSQFLTALITCLLFTRHFEDKGIMEGVRFGVVLGLLLATLMGASYAWLPIPSTLAAAWFGGGFVMGLGLGVIYALTYKQD